MKNNPRLDLLEFKTVKSVFNNRKTQFISQLPALMFLLIVIFSGFFGIQNSSKNLATISIWVIWWPLLVISLALVGRIWCLMCPFGAAGDWIQRLTFYKKVNTVFSLNRKWPVKFRNLSLAAVFFLVITWADFQFNLVNSPLNTAYFIIALLVLVVITALIFEKRSFCRYVCPVSGLIGLYSMFAPFELRAKEKEVCRTCKEKYCMKGNEKGYSCPVFEYPGIMEKNTYCILCTECAKTCHKENISFNLRKFGADFSTISKTRIDESLFILILLGVTVFQTVVMIRPWVGFNENIMMYTGASYDSIRLGLFIALIALPILVYSITIFVSGLIMQHRSFKDIFTGYAYSLIPLGLMMFLAHNIRHLLEEGPGLIQVISDPFGFAWNLFGTSSYMPEPLSNNNILLIQWILMFVGLGYSISAGRGISRRFFQEKGYVPVLILFLAIFIFNLWILGQPILHKH